MTSNNLIRPPISTCANFWLDWIIRIKIRIIFTKFGLWIAKKNLWNRSQFLGPRTKAIFIFRIKRFGVNTAGCDGHTVYLIKICTWLCYDVDILYSSGPWFNMKMSSYHYRKSHCGDKTILRPSYLHNGISYTGKMTSLYWIRHQVISLALEQWNIWYNLMTLWYHCCSKPWRTWVKLLDT